MKLLMRLLTASPFTCRQMLVIHVFFVVVFLKICTLHTLQTLNHNPDHMDVSLLTPC